MLTDPVFIIICLAGGVMAGLASGMLGLGGGVVFMPFLLNILPLAGYTTDNPLQLLATSLFAGVFSSGSSVYFHSKAGNVKPKEGLFLASGAILGSIGASLLASHVQEEFLHYFIAVILFFVVLNMNFGRKKSLGSGNKSLLYILPLAGIVVGAISGMSGIGGGILFVPLLALVLASDFKKAVGTSSMVVLITLFTGAVSYMVINGYDIVNYQAGLLMAVGSISGARAGVKFLKQINEYVIIKIFSLFLLLNIIMLVI